MNEQSKAAHRRKRDWRYANRWLRGRGIDIGCGSDPITDEHFPSITEVVPFDQELGSGDAQYLQGVKNESFDFVVSSHCLEHVRDAKVALVNWARVLKPGGFMIITVPDELLYESGVWPSRHNPDHKHSFTMRATPVIPGSINLPHLLWKLGLDVEKIELLSEHWDRNKLGADQTLGPAECAIEFVARRPNPSRPV